jgi:hypothetical protein
MKTYSLVLVVRKQCGNGKIGKANGLASARLNMGVKR